MYQIQLKWLHISTLFIQCIIWLGMRGYAWIYCAHINVCTHPRIVCVRIYAHSMRILCAYMRAYFAHTFPHTLRILLRILCAYFAHICAHTLHAYFAHICAHTLRIYARIVCAYMRAYLIFFWRIRTHTWRTDTAGMRAYLVCVETLVETENHLDYIVRKIFWLHIRKEFPYFFLPT